MWCAERPHIKADGGTCKKVIVIAFLQSGNFNDVGNEQNQVNYDIFVLSFLPSCIQGAEVGGGLCKSMPMVLQKRNKRKEGKKQLPSPARES